MEILWLMVEAPAGQLTTCSLHTGESLMPHLLEPPDAS